MTVPGFAPVRFAGPFEMWSLDRLMQAAVTQRLGGEWWFAVARPKDQGYAEVATAIEEVQAGIIASFCSGELTSYVHLPGGDMFYTIPGKVWVSDDADGYLAGTLYRGLMDGSYHRSIPSIYLDQPIMVRDSDAKIWVNGGVKADAPRRGPKAIFDWKAFEDEAVRRLWDEGGFTEGWLKSALHGELEEWCNANWERTPGRTSIQEHIDKAEARFLAEKAAI